VEYSKLWTSMVNPKFVEIVCNWATIPLPIIHTSVLEEILNTTRLEQHQIQFCFYKRLQIASHNFDFHCHIMIDLVMLSSLGFESCESMLYWVRYDCLKFGWWFVFSSIHARVMFSGWFVCGFMLYDARSLQWYAPCWFLDMLKFSGKIGWRSSWSSSCSSCVHADFQFPTNFVVMFLISCGFFVPCMC
jgi:hypothetical protein